MINYVLNFGSNSCFAHKKYSLSSAWIVLNTLASPFSETVSSFFHNFSLVFAIEAFSIKKTCRLNRQDNDNLDTSVIL